MTVETPPIRVRIVGATDVGLVREHNEDNFLIVDLDSSESDFSKTREYELGRRGALLVVCDGMGGAAAGEVASHMAVESMRRQMLPADSEPEVAPPEASAATDASAAPGANDPPLADPDFLRMSRKLRDAAVRANQEIYEAACADIAKAGMGTTLTALLLRKSQVVVAQVGDSRAYVLRKGRLVQITHDQSLVNQLLDSGQITPEQAKLFEHSNVILQALGVQEDVEVVLSSETLRQGDRMLLCSDGLVGVVTDEDIQHVMSTTEDLGEAVRKLIDRARDAGGPDNITVILAEVLGDGLPPPGPDELVHYRPMQLDGDRPPERRNWGAEYGFAPPPGSGRDAGAGAPSSRWLSPVTLLAFAAVLALVVTGLVIALVVLPPRSREVTCHITSEPPGLLLLVDDRMMGAVQPGGLDVKLLPGERRLVLHDPTTNARSVAQGVSVVAGQACALMLQGPQLPTVSVLPDAGRGAPDGGADDLRSPDGGADAAVAPTPTPTPTTPDAATADSTPDEAEAGQQTGPQAGKLKRIAKRKVRKPVSGTEPATTPPPDSGTRPETPGTPPEPGTGSTPPPAGDTQATPKSTPVPTPDKPADKPAEKPADKPVDKPVEKPADKPADKPVDKPVEKPADKPADKAVPAPASSPAP
ncbi:MAG: protein phosphatase 2C domain-containing protein [Polyangia bacterium]